MGNSKVWFMFAERARVASAGPAVGGLERMWDSDSEKHSLATTVAYTFLYTRFR